MTADNALRAAPPRIVQVLDGNTALELHRMLSVPFDLRDPVALGSDGLLYRFGIAKVGDIRRGWHVLPLPPLPPLPDSDNG